MAGCLALLAGCTGVPDRSAQARQITTELRGFAGVESVVDSYSNGMTQGVSYNVQIRLSAAATVEQATAVADHYYRATAQGFDKHSQRVNLRADDDDLTLYGQAPVDLDSQLATVRRWWQLRQQLPAAALSWADTGPRTGFGRSVQVNSEQGAADLLAALRAAGSDLAGTQWIIRLGKSRIDLFDGYPDTATADLIERLLGTRQWDIAVDPATAPSLRLAVWEFDVPETEQSARADLALIAGLGHPVTYTIKPNGQQPIVVAVHGCLRDGPPLQQRLNAEFGTC